MSRIIIKKELNDFSGAADDYTEVLKTKVQTQSVYMDRALCYTHCGKFEEAMNDYAIIEKQLWDDNPEDDGSDSFMCLYGNRSLTKHLMGDMEGAKIDHDRSEEILNRQLYFKSTNQKRRF